MLICTLAIHAKQCRPKELPCGALGTGCQCVWELHGIGIQSAEQREWWQWWRFIVECVNYVTHPTSWGKKKLPLQQQEFVQLTGYSHHGWSGMNNSKKSRRWHRYWGWLLGNFLPSRILWKGFPAKDSTCYQKYSVGNGLDRHSSKILNQARSDGLDLSGRMEWLHSRYSFKMEPTGFTDMQSVLGVHDNWNFGPIILSTLRRADGKENGL